MAQPDEFVDFGLWVKARRETLRLTQAELGRMVNYAAETIRAIEAGRRNPSPEMVERLADALRVEPKYRLGFRRRALGQQGALPNPVDAESPATADVALPHHLPARAFPALIGRAELIAALQQRLRTPEVRLLSLVGPPGVGKTRLAHELGLSLQGAWAHGAGWVSLAAVRSVERLSTAIAQALYLTLAPERSAQRVLIEYLRPRALLLVLDNLEQLQADGPALAQLLGELLAEAPQLTLLVTSQVALQLSLEHVITLAPLTVPVATAPPVTLRANPAVQLFVQRACAVDDRFTLSDANLATIAAICRELDGLPLAIELAAARCRLFSPQVLLERLDQRLQFLQHQGGDRDRRHQSLRAALEWSTDLLSDTERSLLAALSVFQAGFSLAAAEAICAQVVPAASLLHAIEQLIHHSLLQRLATAEPELRFALLESIRIFADEQLAPAEHTLLQQAHAAYFLTSIQQAAPRWGQEAWPWIQAVAQEEDNLNAALLHCQRAAEANMLAELVISLAPYWIAQGLVGEGRHWAELALGSSADLPAPVAAHLLLAAADLAFQQSDFALAERHAAAALAYAEGPAATSIHVRARYRLAWVAARQAAYEHALAHLHTAIQLARAADDRHSEAMLSGALGWIARDQGDMAQARAAQHASLVLYRQLGDTLSVAYTLNALGWLARDQGALAEAEQLHRESLALYQAAGHAGGVALALNNLGWTAGMAGELQRAAVFLTESLDLRALLGDERACAWTLGDLGWLAREAGEQRRAADCYHQAWQRYQTLGDRRGMALSEINLALATAELGDLSAAQRLLATAATTLLELRDQRGIARVLEAGAALALRADQPLCAAELLGAAEALRARSGAILPPSEQRWYAALGATVQASDPEASSVAWEAGRQRPLEEVIVGIVPAYLTFDLRLARPR